MSQSEIRAEIVELINGGMLSVSKIKSFFKQHRPNVNLELVNNEARELVAEAKMVIKRGY